jgi:dolichol-phosphate mannosyltransferase
MKLSIVSPVYQSEKIIDELIKRIHSEVSKITDNYEIILVEDGSKDNSWLKIEENCKKDSKLVGLKLSRNFGQHYAITAGLSKAKGDFIIVMDCDLQDNPNSIPLILETLEQGFDVVFTKRIKRNHSVFKKITAQFYNYLIGVLADKKFDINGGSMLGASQMAVTNFLKIKDKDRLYVQLFKWIGFKQTYVFVSHDERFEGKSTYSFSKMLTLAVQGLTSHSNKLLKLSIYIGFLIAFLSFLIGLTIIALYFIKGFSPGWPSLFVAIAFATGLLLMSNGILGLYIGKIFDQSKDRPLYIIEKILEHYKHD